MLERKWQGGMTTRTQSAVGKQRKATRLCKVAFNGVEANADGIAKALIENALKGMVMSTKLLVELAEGDVDVEDALTKRPLRSLVLRLAMEPQMPKEPLKEAADTDANAK
jgi:hypothetical protein